MVNQHLLAIRDNATNLNPLGLLSFDGAFMNGVGDNYTGFGERTMTARFGGPLSRTPTAFVRKSGLAAFTLLSRMGDVRCRVDGAPADVLMANGGALATVRAAAPGGDGAQLTVLVYNSADCGDAVSPALAATVDVAGAPFAPTPADGSVLALMLTVDQAPAANPAAAWLAAGSPALPDNDVLATLWSAAANMTAARGAPMAVAVKAGGVLTLPVVNVPLPGVALWHVVEKSG